MANSSVKVGKIVFAGDLVKVQQGTKYYTITYYDIGKDEYEVHKQRAFRKFDLLSSDTPRFKHWTIDNENYQNNAEFDTGLMSNISAYAHVGSAINVTYYRNASSDDSTSTSQQYPNEIFFAAMDNNVQRFSSYPDNVFAAEYGMIPYPKHRFLGWKKDGIGQLITPGALLSVNNDINMFAQWIRQFKLTLTYNVNGNVQLIEPETDNLTFDDGTSALVCAMPNQHYHLEKWTVKRKVELTNNVSYDATETIVSFVYDPFRQSLSTDNMLSLVMNNDTTVIPSYNIDFYNVSISANIPDVGKVIVKNLSKTSDLAKTITDSLSVNVDYGSNMSLEAFPISRDYKFLSWNGDIDIQLVKRTYVEKQIIDNTSIVALFGEVTRYSVIAKTATAYGGKIEYSKSEGIEEEGIYREGETATVSAYADDQYYIAEYFIDGIRGTSYSILGKTSAQLARFANINENHTVYVKFDTYLIDDAYEPIVDNEGMVLAY